MRRSGPWADIPDGLFPPLVTCRACQHITTPAAHHHHRRHAMTTAQRREDRCPACGSDEVQPFALIIGAAETYGYQCLACSITWAVMQTATPPDPRTIRSAIRRAG